MKLSLLVFLFILTCGCNAQSPVTPIANSQVEANAPKGESFDKFLKRDLTNYFCKRQGDCHVEYEYLRQGATQSGVSYPKYYLWTRCFTKERLNTEGAVRVAAIDQKYFEITDYLSATEITSSPDNVRGVFPAALVDKILQKAKH